MCFLIENERKKEQGFNGSPKKSKVERKVSRLRFLHKIVGLMKLAHVFSSELTTKIFLSHWKSIVAVNRQFCIVYTMSRKLSLTAKC
jgi:hypothetical protein